MRFPEMFDDASRKRLERLATPLAEGCLPWLVSRIGGRVVTRGDCYARGYARAWAGLAIREVATEERLPGLGATERERAIGRAVEYAVHEVLRWFPSRAALPRRKAA
jgi:hypothetical protein